MRVCLMDVDSKIPNLALMRLSAYHKAMGDEVKLGYEPLFDQPDFCYASKVFDFTPDPEYWPECEVVKGGPAWSTDHVKVEGFDRIMPDYSLYRCGYALGRFTRGCPNRCPWCVVPGMDGQEVRKVADLTDFWSGQDVVRLLDDNIMADEDVFVEACAQLSESGAGAVFDALDARLVTDRAAEALATVRQAPGTVWHFAWDGHHQDDAVHRCLETLGRHGVKPWRTEFYVLIGFNTSPEYDMHRVMELHRMGSNPFVMPYDKTDRYQRDLARWCNNKRIFKTCSFDEYRRSYGNQHDRVHEQMVLGA